MAKLRKMLGKLEDPCVESLKGLIETQSKTTLAAWALDYAETNYLGIYENIYKEDLRFREIVTQVRACINGTKTLKEIKPVIKTAREIAKEAEKDPVAQAAARAVSTALAVIQTPTSALGFVFYGAAAAAYDRAGLEEKPEVYDALAVKEEEQILQSLEEAAVKDEPNPVKVNWNC